MSEVDRLTNSGLYPALPMSDKRSSKDGSGDKPSAGAGAPKSKDPKVGATPPRPPKSLLDEYA